MVTKNHAARLGQSTRSGAMRHGQTTHIGAARHGSAEGQALGIGPSNLGNGPSKGSRANEVKPYCWLLSLLFLTFLHAYHPCASPMRTLDCLFSPPHCEQQ
mmetsp:Transcript_13621/g.26322  ORF Transcript_13621/g.26322 Transcript_13621/m.26322 type:complete len:101 (-) Transcript_13621:91-393(-)